MTLNDLSAVEFIFNDDTNITSPFFSPDPINYMHRSINQSVDTVFAYSMRFLTNNLITQK